MQRQATYEALSVGTLSLAAVAAILALAGAALQQTLSVAAASLCFLVWLVPGLYFLAYARRLRSRDLALAHTAAFARSRGAIDVRELAENLRVSAAEAERILRIAVREGHLRGRFVANDRFVAERTDGSPTEAKP